MDRSSAHRTLIALVLALALLVVACTPTSDTTTSTPPPSTSTTEPSTTEPPTTETPSATTLGTIPGNASDSLDPALVARMREELAELALVTEQVRGLPFLTAPEVTILDEPEFADRVSTLIADELDEVELATDARYLTMLGLLEPGSDLYTLWIDLYTEQVGGFYDGETKELVVPAAADGFTSLQRITVVHELVHALSDQHFDFNDEFERRFDEGNGDDAAAFQALIEGDATHSQLVHMEELSPAEALAAAVESLSIDTTILDSVPAWMQADLFYPYQQGLNFTEHLVSEGGLAAVDRAYQQQPDTTEQVLDPVKYLRDERPRDLPALTASLAGWDVHDEGSFGEWGLRLLFTDTLSPGLVTQVGAGWGNDHYRVFALGDDVGLVMHYVGDAESDAEELADALIAHARDTMNAGAAVESEGGLLYDTNGIYVFIDRVEDELFFVASTDLTAGASLRTQLGL